MLQVHMKHPVLNDTGNKTAKTRYLILNIFDLLHDRHGCGRTACSLLTMLIAATLSKLSLRRLGGDNALVTMDGNDVVVALTKVDESALIAARAFNRPAASLPVSSGRHGATSFEARKASPFCDWKK